MNGKITLEEHFAIPETVGESLQYAVPGRQSDLERRLYDIGAERLGEMDANGIELAILSLNAPGIQAMFDTRQAVAAARKANDVLAEAVARRPGRFAGFAALPMQDPDAAALELTRAVRELGFKGALVNGFSQVGDPESIVYYDHSRYLPFWKTVAELDVPFYLHPRDPLVSRTPQYDGHPWFTGASWAFGVETAIHALRLMASGLFDRHPGLTIVLGHLGEGIPYNIWRLDHRIGKRPRDIPARRPLAEYLRSNCYLTTSGNFRTPTLVDAIAEVGVERILFSVDYPFEETSDAAKWFDAVPLLESDRVKMGRANAASLFRLLVAAS